jgi:probable rRNA maturation factor
VQLSVSIISLDDSQALNLLYREKNKPTNVISLEYPDNREQFNMLTGELFLCDEVIVNEATEQSKSIINHYMHMLVHGLLHLQGYDHILDDEAEIMEALEVQILKQFGIEDPYGERKV